MIWQEMCGSGAKIDIVILARPASCAAAPGTLAPRTAAVRLASSTFPAAAGTPSVFVSRGHRRCRLPLATLPLYHLLQRGERAREEAKARSGPEGVGCLDAPGGGRADSYGLRGNILKNEERGEFRSFGSYVTGKVEKQKQLSPIYHKYYTTILRQWFYMMAQ